MARKTTGVIRCAWAQRIRQLRSIPLEICGGQAAGKFVKSLDRIPARTAESDALSKDLKRRGFNFVGSTICYALNLKHLDCESTR